MIFVIPTIVHFGSDSIKLIPERPYHHNDLINQTKQIH